MPSSQIPDAVLTMLPDGAENAAEGLKPPFLSNVSTAPARPISLKFLLSIFPVLKNHSNIGKSGEFCKFQALDILIPYAAMTAKQISAKTKEKM